ncbi:MAG: nicotinate (nicotinamide) nucleotide adenylyltransferase [Proteobacteria bacterium]|nr:MAG: nicotinate (nicotinamide) nucleotide adenylyltransferase [Pseudomonadota bacterium]
MNGGVINSFEGISGRVGVLGGSFDPVHTGHALMAECAIGARSLDKVIYIPASRNPLKQSRPAATDSQRLSMLKLALKDTSASLICTAELDRPGPSYTVDSLRQAKSECGAGTEIFLIFGSDQISTLHLWREFHLLFELAKLVPITRHVEARVVQPSSHLSEAQNRILLQNLLHIDCPASSSSIRAQLGKQNLEAARAQLHPEVYEYIKRHGLYRA